jgi:CDP-2,3-bis-(O-geranylgeranyl)-sn-glycerol synthase
VIAVMSSVRSVDSLSCAVFIVVTFVLAGILQTLWFRTRLSWRLAIPLDGGATLRGRRFLGQHKTLRGFVVMIPAAGVAFLILRQVLVVSHSSLGRGLWQLSPGSYALLGMLAGLGFMLGELPNSFLKRQLGIRPGAAPSNLAGRIVFGLLDRLDSIVGMLLALSLIVPTPWQIWVYVCAIGPAIHGGFSFLFTRLKLKTVPA